jgi:hypothetical protein
MGFIDQGPPVGMKSVASTPNMGPSSRTSSKSARETEAREYDFGGEMQIDLCLWVWDLAFSDKSRRLRAATVVATA